MSVNKTQNSQKTLNLVAMAMLIAIEIVLVVTNLGFILVPPISITILHIPVIIGAIILGWKGGLVMGTSFGLLSMINATFRGTSPADLAFSPFYSGNPVGSLIMCVGCRMLLGFAAGILFEFLSKKMKSTTLSAVIASFLATLIHTTTVMSCLWLLFPEFSLTFKAVLQTIFALNFLVEAGAAVIFAAAFAKVIPMLRKKFG